MFDISSGELGVIAVVALLVLGPEKLPGAARVAGAMLRRARTAYSQVRDQVERELAAEDLKQQVRAAQEQLREVTAPLQEAIHNTRSAAAEIDAVATAPVAEERTVEDGADVGPPPAAESGEAGADDEQAAEVVAPDTAPPMPSATPAPTVATRD
jgi:sec-independent protein translocase protein TatB